jgi:hypothetical protein
MEIVKQEIWRPVPGYENYHVSDLGKVRSKGKELRLTIVKSGYVTVALCKSGVAKTFTVHRLVATVFLGKSRLVVDHINGVKHDNRLSNLRYCTQRENVSECQMTTNLTGYTGVSINPPTYRKRFRSRIRVNGKLKDLGSFPTAELAGAAYQFEKLELTKSQYNV